MSLLEDIFLQDETEEAHQLERIIEDEEDEPVNSDNNSEREDEAEEEKRRVDPTKIKKVHVVKNPRFVLNPARLTGPRGIQVIPDHFKDFKFKGKGHEKEDLDLMLKKLEHWAYRLYPKFEFADCLKKIETLGRKRPVMVHLKKIRSDQFVSDETVVQQDSSDEDIPTQHDDNEDEFDKLLQQQINIARNTPAPSSVKNNTSIDNRPLTTMPKVASSPSISDEQRERMMRSRKLAEERRLSRLNNSKADKENVNFQNDKSAYDNKLISNVDNPNDNLTLDRDRSEIIQDYNEGLYRHKNIEIRVNSGNESNMKNGNPGNSMQDSDNSVDGDFDNFRQDSLTTRAVNSHRKGIDDSSDEEMYIKTIKDNINTSIKPQLVNRNPQNVNDIDQSEDSLDLDITDSNKKFKARKPRKSTIESSDEEMHSNDNVELEINDDKLPVLDHAVNQDLDNSININREFDNLKNSCINIEAHKSNSNEGTDTNETIEADINTCEQPTYDKISRDNQDHSDSSSDSDTTDNEIKTRKFDMGNSNKNLDIKMYAHEHVKADNSPSIRSQVFEESMDYSDHSNKSLNSDKNHVSNRIKTKKAGRKNVIDSSDDE